MCTTCENDPGMSVSLNTLYSSVTFNNKRQRKFFFLFCLKRAVFSLKRMRCKQLTAGTGPAHREGEAIMNQLTKSFFFSVQCKDKYLLCWFFMVIYSVSWTWTWNMTTTKNLNCPTSSRENIRIQMKLIILNSTVGAALIIHDVQIKLHRPSYSSSVTTCLLQLLYHDRLNFVGLQSGFNPSCCLYITTH